MCTNILFHNFHVDFTPNTANSLCFFFFFLIRFPTLCESLNLYISIRTAPTTNICNAIASICIRSVSNGAAAGCTVLFSPCARRFMNDVIYDVITSSLTWTILNLLRCLLFIHMYPFQRLAFVMFIHRSWCRLAARAHTIHVIWPQAIQ